MSDQLDPQLIEQTKQQIRSLVAEIAQFAKSEMAPQEFYGEMLPRVVQALAAVGGVVWTMEDQGRLTLQAHVNFQESRLADKKDDEKMRHGRLLHRVVRSGEGMIVPPHMTSGEGDQATGNPTDYLVVLGPLKTELEVVGVVEIFQRADTGVSAQKGYLRFLLQVCDLAGEYLKSRQLRSFSDRQVLWTQLEEFTRLVHASLNPRDTAYTIANEGRRLIECDRVSVAVRKGNKCYVEAVSGQDLFDKRSNTIRLLNRLSSVVVAGGEPVWYTGDTKAMAPQVEDAVQEYVDESHSKTVAVLPLARPLLEEKERDRPDDPVEQPEPVGALIVEQIEDSRVPEKMVQRVDVVAQHSAVALANAAEHESLFLMPLWRTLGKSRWVVQGRRLPKVILATIGVLLAIIALIVVQWDFRLHSTGYLEPVHRRDVYAGVDGIVEKVLVDHNSLVAEQEKLVELRNFEMEEKYTQVAGDLKRKQKEYEGIQYLLVDSGRQMPEDERNRYRGQLAELDAEISNLKYQKGIYGEYVDKLDVYSPMKGRVVTWNVKDNLTRRPVRRDERLMRIAEPDGAWQLELHMPEDRMGFIMRAQNEVYDKIRQRLRAALREKVQEKSPSASGEDLDREVAKQLEQVTDKELRAKLKALTGEEMEDRLEVSYIVATEPGKTHTGWAEEISYSAEVRPEEGNTVLIKVSINKSDLQPEHIRDQAGVSGKVACGTRPIGYVWFYQAFGWLQKMAFRWL